MSGTFHPGELVDITIRRARVVRVSGSLLTAAYETPVDQAELPLTVQVGVSMDADAVTVERVAPAEWPPRPGDLWRDSGGRRWFFRRAFNGEPLTGYTSGAGWTDDVSALLADGNAPWTLLYRDDPAPTSGAVSGSGVLPRLVEPPPITDRALSDDTVVIPREVSRGA